MRSILLHSSLLVLSLALAPERIAHPACPWCGAGTAPASTGWSSRIAPASEAGTPLEISGTVYGPDGRTPAPGVLIYAWQPDAEGAYVARVSVEGRTFEHAAFRGWARTDAAGRYRFLTIRPGAAPGAREAAQVHLTITPPGGREAPIASVTFGDDRGRLVADKLGGLHVVRDITLERGS